MIDTEVEQAFPIYRVDFGPIIHKKATIHL
jgi:hypothetical protein